MKSAITVLTLLAGTILLPSATYAAEPDSRVARISYVSGEVSYQRGDDEGWNDVRVNTPLVTGDSFYAPEGARAELDLGRGIVIRVDGGTEVELVNNSRDVAQLGLNGGVLDLSVRSFPSDFTLELDTPTGAATILEPGRYRLDMNDRVTTYSVIEGSISLAVDGEQLDVREGESLEIEATDPPTYGYGQPAARTSFDSWANDRDSRLESSASARYVNNDVVGYEDLDDHGTWRDSREYGRVWMPSRVHADWAPYQEGRWIWQDPYGWTWVSYEPWGWAPYHYGRWIHADNNWCWVPPPPRGYRGPAAVMSIEPVYAPALVAFVGGRNWGVSLSIGGPAIGWVPLAPRERYYYPWQPAPRVVVNNYTNITVINAVTVVNYNTFTTGAVRPLRIDRAQIARAPVMGSIAIGITPGRASLVVTPERRQQQRAIPRPRAERTLVARLVPPPRPQQFAQKISAIERTGRPVSRPVAIEASVGKPFAPGVRARAGIKAFSAPAPNGRRELKMRPGAEARAPKPIARDIAPPVPVAPSGRRERQRGPAGARGKNAPMPPEPIRPEATQAPATPETPPTRVRPDRPGPRKDRPADPAPQAAPQPPPQQPTQPPADAAPRERGNRLRDRTAPTPQPAPQATPPPTPKPSDTVPRDRGPRSRVREAPAPQPAPQATPPPTPQPSDTVPRDRGPRSRVREAPAPQSTPQAAPQPPAPRKDPESGIGQAKPSRVRNAPAPAQPAPRAAPPEAKKDPESAVGQAKQPAGPPKRPARKPKGKNQPEPPPPPPPEPN